MKMVSEQVVELENKLDKTMELCNRILCSIEHNYARKHISVTMSDPKLQDLAKADFERFLVTWREEIRKL